MDRVRHSAPNRGRAARIGDGPPWLLAKGLPDRGGDQRSDCGGAARSPAIRATAATQGSFAPTDFWTYGPWRAALVSVAMRFLAAAGGVRGDPSRWLTG